MRERDNLIYRECGIAPLFLVLVLAGLFAVGFGAWYVGQKVKAPEPVFCTQDAKQCPDGSYVGRTGPKCEFAPCPSETLCEGGPCPHTSTTIDTSTWKTYRNEKYGFEVKYPGNFSGPERVKFSMYPFYQENITGDGFFHRVNVSYCGESGLEEHCTNTPVNMSLEFFVLENPFNSIRKDFEDIDVSESLGKVFINGIEGIHAMVGVEGIGQFYAVFPLEQGTKTLVMQRDYVSEGSVGIFQGVKDFISFNDQKKVFDQVLSTFKFVQ